MDTVERNQLNDRTRLRNDKLWLTLDWGGLLDPLSSQQAIEDSLGAPGIENYMAVADEPWDIKSAQRDRTYEIDQFAVDQDRYIAEEKVVVGLAKLAIQKVTDEYVLAVKLFGSRVRDLLMGAKEFAALVEREQLAVDKDRAILAVAKELLRRKDVIAKIYHEYIARLMVEVDIAKAKTDVAKAHVRTILADIAAGEADIRLITAEIEQYMAQADKAGLRADVAMLFAEKLTKELSKVKLDMGRAEIVFGYEIIQQKLDDALALLAIQEREEEVKTDYAEAALEEIRLLFPEEKVSEDLRETEQLNAREVFNYAQSVTYQNILAEIALRALAVNARMALSNTKKDVREQEDSLKTWAEDLLNEAQKWVHKHSQRGTTEYHTQYEYITG